MIEPNRFPLPTLALCAVAGIAASGPIHAQLVPPQLLGIDTSGSDTAAFALPGTPLIAPVTQIRLRFDQPLAILPAESPTNFRVVEAGADAVLATSACGAQAAGDDTLVEILGARWNGTGNEIALRLNAPAGLARGRYRVIACDTLLGLGGLAFDGDNDGLPGGVALRDLAIRETSHVENPGLDDSIDGWEAVSLGLFPIAKAHVPDDADDAASSGALRIGSAPFPGSALVLPPVCVNVGFSTASPSWRTRLRYRVLQGQVRVQVTTWFGFSGDGGEIGCVGPGITDSRSFDAMVSTDFDTFDTGWRTAQPFPLATTWIHVSSRDGLPFEILLDDVGFSLDSQLIFRDDFGH
jgi:hypothetical protein